MMYPNYIVVHNYNWIKLKSLLIVKSTSQLKNKIFIVEFSSILRTDNALMGLSIFNVF